MKLQKFLQITAKVSRRKADQLISQGKVKVNGNTVKEYWFDVDVESDLVQLEDKKLSLKSQKFYYYLLNKPSGYITTMFDPNGRPTVWDLVKDKVKDRVYPVGRLDKDTEGLLILTNDGDFANKIMHPRYKLPKRYEVIVEGILSKKDLLRLQKGIVLSDGYKTLPAKAKILKISNNRTRLEIEIREGKKRQIKNMFKSLGHRVLYLKRLSIGPITLEKIEKVGEIREMTVDELKKIDEFLGKLTCGETKKIRKD
ncbi:MAG: rRNA synthase [Thermotogaceae bacterium]|jgi:23S rRNA pseudouridine2605 synthase|nr:rRNA synthase [Thermotogaceae bacterium]MDN5337677.1 rRNA synthase [Thermotogaceae bacterium]